MPALPGKVLDPNSLDCNYVYWKILAVALADEPRAASHPHFSEKWVRYSKFASLFCGSAPGPGAGAAGLGGSPAPAGANNNPPSHRKVLRHPSPEKNSPMTTPHFFKKTTDSYIKTWVSTFLTLKPNKMPSHVIHLHVTVRNKTQEVCQAECWGNWTPKRHLSA